MARLIPITYVTSSEFKMEECQTFVEYSTLSDGRKVADVFSFEFRPVAIPEMLEVSIERMVRAEVKEAYRKLRVPCIVEHAGLIFADYAGASYPGGLTKPMWNTLGDDFLKETNSIGRRVVAQAVVAYCDGKGVHTFVGETEGELAKEHRGDRRFYWDTILIADGAEGLAAGKTYAEIVRDPSLGLAYKMTRLSQSAKALMKFLEFRLVRAPELFRER